MAWVVSACAAKTMGWRGYVGTTAVPSSMRGTSRPTTASDVSASGPKICGIQYDAKPSSAARRVDATTSSIPPCPATSPPKIPMRMRRRLSSPRERQGRALFSTAHADVAQLVEHHLAKGRVAGSNPVVRSGASDTRRPRAQEQAPDGPRPRRRRTEHTRQGQERPVTEAQRQERPPRYTCY